MERLLDELNSNQRAAVTHDAPVLQVLAPPGSGKTKTLTARVAYLISHQHIHPSNMIVCTFTKKASREMKDRIISIMGQEDWGETDGKKLVNQLIMGTFHSVARTFLVAHGHQIGIPRGFGIADTADTKDLLKRITKRRGGNGDPSSFRARISALKARSISPADYMVKHKQHEEQEFAAIYAEYEELLRTSNLLDYDDLLLRCVDLLKQHPECVSHIETVLIDEFQDTNLVQFQLMQLFAQKKRAITIVGDPDQSIYGFRNAEIENLNRMTNIYRNTCRVDLEQNYRSSGAILRAANEVIEQDTSRPAKTLSPTHSFGERPTLRKVPTAKDEASWIVAEINRSVGMTGQLLGHDDFAILLRSASLSRQIESALGRAGIPYRMVGGHRFFDRVEVKIILDYLRVINQPEHNDALARVVNVPSRKVGDTTIKGLLEEAERQKVPLWRLILDASQGTKNPKTKISTQADKGLQSFVKLVLDGRKKMTGPDTSVIDLIEHVVKRAQLKDYIKTKYPEDHESRWENVEELVVQACTLSQLSDEEAALQGFLPQDGANDQDTSSAASEALAEFLANIALASEVQKDQDDDGEPLARVTISTIHAAKGLEWPVVFIPAVYEGSIPHSRAEDGDEERRLLYVGMTRAQAMLYLSCPTDDSRDNQTKLSDFLEPLDGTKFLGACGPVFDYSVTRGIAQLLRRDCPSEVSVCRAWDCVSQKLDDIWPLDGSKLAGPATEKYYDGDRPFKRQKMGFQSTSTLHATTMNQSMSCSTATMSTTFMSAGARLQEMEKEPQSQSKPPFQREPLTRSNFSTKKTTKPASANQGSIVGFFQKRSDPSYQGKYDYLKRPVKENSSPATSDTSTHAGNMTARKFLSNTILPTSDVVPKQAQPQYRSTLRRAPSYQRPQLIDDEETITSSRSRNSGLLPSSPITSDVEDGREPTKGRDLIGTGKGVVADENTENRAPTNDFKPAAVLHQTSMAQARTSSVMQKKRYGVKPSMNGWANRHGGSRACPRSPNRR